MRKILKLIPLLLIALAIAAGYVTWQRWQTQPLPLEAARDLDVPTGSTLDGLARQLETEGLVHSAWELKVLARLRGDAAQIKAGEYVLQPGMTLDGLLDQLVAGRVKLHALTIVEGTTFADMLAQLRAHEAVSWTLEDATPMEIAERLELPGDHPEGWFLPETYHFPRGTTDIAFLARAHAAMEDVLAAAWAERDDELPIETPYEALILASIIEKETAVESERTRIAGVFTRRLEKGMRLQTDPTVIYGLGEDYRGDIRSRHLRADTPYNTYTRSGLPPTPIALPSRESVFAAVHPAPGEALYFVARGPGREHVFSATLEEHNRAVREYAMQRRPLDDDAGDGGGR